MKLLVDCRSIRIGRSRGIENFAIAVIQGIAGFGGEIVVDVCQADKELYKKLFKDRPNIQCISDPVQGLYTRLLEGPFPVNIITKIWARMARLLGWNPFGRRSVWARKTQADAVYYPFHLDAPQHPRLPVVVTVHAVLPEYGPVQMELIRKNIISAKAVVTSWPHPFDDLRKRYPAATNRLFLVPYAAVQNTRAETDFDITSLGITEAYYFYPAVLAERKNHARLIEAYGRLIQRGFQPPLMVCSGGGHKSFKQKLSRLAAEWHVADRFLFLDYLPDKAVAALYRECRACVCASLWEAGIAVFQEGGRLGKPILCADIPPARAHAQLMGLEVCFFNPTKPEDLADKVVQFEENIGRFKKASRTAAETVQAVNKRYMGYCYADILRYAAGKNGKPDWAPYLDPLRLDEEIDKKSV